MNIRLLRKIKRTILKRPDQFEMDAWFSEQLVLGHTEQCKPAGGCGYAACIAGWAIVLSDKRSNKINVAKHYSELVHYNNDIFERARKLLGLTCGQANFLFLEWRWPSDFKYPYRKSMSPLGRARIAAKMIDHFIKVKGEHML